MKKLLLLALTVMFILCGCNGENRNNAQSDNHNLFSAYSFNYSRMAYKNSDLYYECNTVRSTDNWLQAYYDITVTDLTTNHKSVLCSSPQCTHTDETCTAYYSSYPEFIMYNDNYLIVGVRTQSETGANTGGMTFYISDLNGENRRLLYTSADGETPYGSFILGDDCLIYDCFTLDGDNETRYIKKIDLATSEVNTITKISNNQNFIGGFGNYIYLHTYPDGISTLTGKHNVDIIDTNGNVIKKNAIEWKESESTVSIYGEYLVETFKNEPKIKLTDLETDTVEEYNTEYPVEVISFIDNNVICYSSEIDETQKFLTPMEISRNEGTAKIVDWRREGNSDFAVDIIAYNNDKYLLAAKERTRQVTYDSARPNISQMPETVTETYTIYATILKSDYTAGNRNITYIEE